MPTPREELDARWRALLGFLLMGEPYVEHGKDERGRPRVRLHLADRGVWTVHDATFSNFRHHRTGHGSPGATDRVFVAPDGTKRLFLLKPDGDRRLEAAVLAQQLRAAEYVARERFRPEDVHSGRPACLRK